MEFGTICDTGMRKGDGGGGPGDKVFVEACTVNVVFGI
jgi:hypothetical protein